jgi:hypothetical protein
MSHWGPFLLGVVGAFVWGWSMRDLLGKKGE